MTLNVCASLHDLRLHSSWHFPKPVRVWSAALNFYVYPMFWFSERAVNEWSFLLSCRHILYSADCREILNAGCIFIAGRSWWTLYVFSTPLHSIYALIPGLSAGIYLPRECSAFILQRQIHPALLHSLNKVILHLIHISIPSGEGYKCSCFVQSPALKSACQLFNCIRSLKMGWMRDCS